MTRLVDMIRRLAESGDIAIIPIGFRCYTKNKIQNCLGFSQPTLPFDNGFFSPDSVANVFLEPSFSLSVEDPSSFALCEKNENFYLKGYGFGVAFSTRDIDFLDHSISSTVNSIERNRFLDSTRAYYTFIPKHGFVLAHYNWHKSSAKYFGSLESSFDEINSIYTRRIQRMFELCKKAKYVLFVYDESDSSFLSVDSAVSDLSSFSRFHHIISKVLVADFSCCSVEQLQSSRFLQSLLDNIQLKSSNV